MQRTVEHIGFRPVKGSLRRFAPLTVHALVVAQRKSERLKKKRVAAIALAQVLTRALASGRERMRL